MTKYYVVGHTLPLGGQCPIAAAEAAARIFLL